MRTLVVLLASAAFVGAVCAAPPALAQVSSPNVPIATSPPQSPFGDRGGDAGDFSGYLLSAPLRLSLEGSIIPKAGGFPNCASREDDVGNSVGGIPVQHYAEWRLTPRLVLSGFAQLGCPIDAGMGAALTYAVPLRRSLQLVFGAGIYAAPGQIALFRGPQASLPQYLGSLVASAAQGPHIDSPVNGAARVDLVLNAKDGHPYNVGVEISSGKQAIKFGVGF
jgi:uncharacterized glyoxalase superfamily protein PhnB